jgi:hypothetical protein
MGDVEVVRLLVTHLRTVKNEEVIISNSTILGSEIINYSSLARERGLILHTMVGIGYDIPGGRSMAMLLEAAAPTHSNSRMSSNCVWSGRSFDTRACEDLGPSVSGFIRSGGWLNPQAPFLSPPDTSPVPTVLCLKQSS